MKIEVWSDIACPYCYVAHTRLAAALARFEYKDSVQMVMRSFELEPDMAQEPMESQHHAVMRKYRQDSLSAQHTLDQAAAAAALSGIEINWDRVITTNTFNAHRLIHFARTIGKAAEMEKRLFEAYFTRGEHIGRDEVLEEIAREFGLDAREMLRQNQFGPLVRKDEKDAADFRIRAVPYMLFDEKFAVKGARTEDEFLELLHEFRLEAIKCGIEERPEAPGCEDGFCGI